MNCKHFQGHYEYYDNDDFSILSGYTPCWKDRYGLSTDIHWGRSQVKAVGYTVPSQEIKTLNNCTHFNMPLLFIV